MGFQDDTAGAAPTDDFSDLKKKKKKKDIPMDFVRLFEKCDTLPNESSGRRH